MKFNEIKSTRLFETPAILADILDPNLIVESRGLAARAPGEIFKSTTDDSVIYFRTIRFWPEAGGSYPNEDLLAQVAEVQASMGSTKIAWINKPPRVGGFGIALFDTEDGDILAFGRYFSEVKADLAANHWDNKTGVPGYRYASKAAEKTVAGMTPQDVLTQSQVDLTAEDIVRQIANKFGEFSPLTDLAQKISDGHDFPIFIDKVEGMSFTAFRDYFCELLHPIALQQGFYSGNAGEAADDFLGPKGFSDCLISFGTTKTEGLSDSVMINPQGKKVKVSSKGARGATASVANLIDAVNEAEAAGNSQLLTRHRDIIDLVKDVQRAGQRGAPLLLGTRFGIITEKDVATINELHNKPPTTLAQLLQNKNLSSNVKKLAQERGTNDPNNLNAYYHLIAAVAHKAAEIVNSQGNFSAAASEILNNTALVQVYTHATNRGTEWILQDFDTKYPSSTVTGVLFKAGKTYYSTGIKGNFTFEILRNKARDPDPDDNGATTRGVYN